MKKTSLREAYINYGKVKKENKILKSRIKELEAQIANQENSNPDDCENCDGLGWYWTGYETCQDCKGTGKKQKC